MKLVKYNKFILVIKLYFHSTFLSLKDDSTLRKHQLCLIFFFYILFLFFLSFLFINLVKFVLLLI